MISAHNLGYYPARARVEKPNSEGITDEKTPLNLSFPKKPASSKVFHVDKPIVDGHVEARKLLSKPLEKVPLGENPFGDRKMVSLTSVGSLSDVMGIVARYLSVEEALGLRRLSKRTKKSFDLHFYPFAAEVLNLNPINNVLNEMHATFRACNQALFLKSLFKKAKKLTLDDLSGIKQEEEKRSFEAFAPWVTWEVSKLGFEYSIFPSFEEASKRFDDEDFLEAVAQIKSLELPGVIFIPPQIGKLSNLTSLTINSPRTIPPEISSLTKLENLTILPGLAGDEVPSGLDRFSNLKKLSLYGSFKKIPSEIGNLEKLESLTIEGMNAYTWINNYSGPQCLDSFSRGTC